MPDWLKKLFGRDSAPVSAAAQEAAEPAAFDIDTATLTELVEENVRLGREIDALRDRRRLINYRAAQLRDGSK